MDKHHEELQSPSIEMTTAGYRHETVNTHPLTKSEYVAVAEFRHAIRKFLAFSESEARKAGITPQQHQLLLAIKGYPEREMATVSELAERLQMKQHSMVGLINRTEVQNLVRREQSMVDRRNVFISLTEKGEGLLDTLTVIHRQELYALQQKLFELRPKSED